MAVETAATTAVEMPVETITVEIAVEARRRRRRRRLMGRRM